MWIDLQISVDVDAVSMEKARGIVLKAIGRHHCPESPRLGARVAACVLDKLSVRETAERLGMSEREFAKTYAAMHPKADEIALAINALAEALCDLEEERPRLFRRLYAMPAREYYRGEFEECSPLH